MINERVKIVLAVTDWLKQRDGIHPEHEAIEIELAGRLIESHRMFQEEQARRTAAEDRLAMYEQGRP